MKPLEEPGLVLIVKALIVVLGLFGWYWGGVHSHKGREYEAKIFKEGWAYVPEPRMLRHLVSNMREAIGNLCFQVRILTFIVALSAVFL